MSFFDSLELLPEDPILGIAKSFAADPRPCKVNLGIGSYKDSEGASYVLDCVRDAEADLVVKNLNKDYLPIDGSQQFLKLSENLIFGNTLHEQFSGGCFLTQTIGGTGALSLGGQLLSQNINDNIYLPNTTWLNHQPLFAKNGFKIHQYNYYDHQSHQVDFPRISKEISEMPPGSIILLHACCHNPTGIDPSNEQWMELSSFIKKQKVIPFFDFAYQGFKKNIDEDAFPIRHFVSQGHELFVAYSFAKNFGLYGERVGLLAVVSQNKDNLQSIGSQLKKLIRNNYSSPPRRGVEIASHILASNVLKKEWINELANMRDRLNEMRHTLVTGLQAKGKHGDWTFLNRQHGFFSFCGLNESQVHRLKKDYAIYMPNNGRINVGGLNGHNIEYVIDAILDVVHS